MAFCFLYFIFFMMFGFLQAMEPISFSTNGFPIPCELTRQILDFRFQDALHDGDPTSKICADMLDFGLTCKENNAIVADQQLWEYFLNEMKKKSVNLHSFIYTTLVTTSPIFKALQSVLKDDLNVIKTKPFFKEILCNPKKIRVDQNEQKMCVELARMLFLSADEGEKMLSWACNYNNYIDEKYPLMPENPLKDVSRFNLLKSLFINYHKNNDFQQEIDRCGHNNLHRAVLQRDEERILSIVEHDENIAHKINRRDVLGVTPFLYACYFASSCLINLFIKKGADINAVDQIGNTPLEAALYRSNYAAAQILLNHNADLEINQKYQSALLMSCSRKNKEIFDVILKKSSWIDKELGYNPTTPLLMAVQKRNKYAVEKLVERGVDIHHEQTKSKITAWLLAAKLGLSDIIDYFLQNNLVSIDQKNSKGETMLMMAAANKRLATLRYLLEKGACDDGQALQKAAQSNFPEGMKLLIEYGSPIDYVSESGETLLMLAVLHRAVEATDFLLKNRADVYAKNRYGVDVSYYARMVPGDAVLSVLKPYLAKDVIQPQKHDVDIDGFIKIIEQNNHEKFAELLASGFDCNQFDVNGCTPLLYCVQNNKDNFIDPLLNANASPGLASEKSKSAIQQAIENRNLPLVKRFLDKMPQAALLLLPIALLLRYAELGSMLVEKCIDNPSLGIINRWKLFVNACLRYNQEPMKAFIKKYGLTAAQKKYLIHQIGNRGTRDLLQCCFDHKVITIQDEKSMVVLLMLAASRGELGLLRLLISAGVDVTLKNKIGNRASCRAKNRHHYEAAQLLEDQEKKQGLTTHVLEKNEAFIKAVQNDDKKSVLMLLQEGVDVNCYNKNYQHGLLEAIRLDNFEMAKLLIEKGAHPRWRDGSQGEHNALTLSVATEKSKNWLELLLESGCSINTSNVHRQTLLMMAVKRNNYELAQFALERGAQVDKADSRGNTPLLTAVWDNYENLVELLLKNGANPTIKNKGQTNALMLVQAKKYTGSVEPFKPYLKKT